VIPGPQGLPILAASKLPVINCTGATQWRSTVAHTPSQPLLFSTFFRPTTSGTDRVLLSNCGYFADNTADFPLAFALSTSNLLSLKLSNGGDYSVDRTTSSDAACVLNDWNFGAFGLINGALTALNLNGVVKLDTHSVSANSTPRLLTVAQHSNLSAAGGTGQPFVGQLYNPRMYSWDGSNFTAFANALMRDIDMRNGLLYEWQPRMRGPRGRRT
jgi:hypothetical protein